MVEYETGEGGAKGGNNSRVNVEVNGTYIESIDYSRNGYQTLFNNGEFEGEVVNVDVLIQGEGDKPGGRVEVLPKGGRVHLFHLNVNPDARRKGMGADLMDIAKQYAERGPFTKFSGRVRGADTREFFIDYGINEEYVNVVNVEGGEYMASAITDKESANKHGGGTYNHIEDNFNGVPLEDVFG